MVHALKEIWRVLVPRGWLLDVRPLSASTPLEVVAGKQVWPAGRVDDSAGLPDEHAANEALRTVVHDGWFVREHQARFDYAWYWDTLDELRAHIAEKWSDWMHIPDAVGAEAARLLAASSTSARVRLRLTVVMARYRKSSAVQVMSDEGTT
jgi:hypothetical protein